MQVELNTLNVIYDITSILSIGIRTNFLIRSYYIERIKLAVKQTFHLPVDNLITRFHIDIILTCWWRNPRESW